MRFGVCFFLCLSWMLPTQGQPIHLVFTSDLHYGITRPHFRGQDSVASALVNKAQVEAINSLSSVGIDAVEGIVVTGDIANREESGIQAASVSWKEFLHDYRDGIHLRNQEGQSPLLLVTPGNHDASNAAGHSKIMFRDAGSMTGMIALEKHVQLDSGSYDYHREKLNYSTNIDGVHLVFVNIWPDSANRIWLDSDLRQMSDSTPVLIFTHDPPVGDARHFTNPDPVVSESVTDPFEHLLSEVYKDTALRATRMEQEGLVVFLKTHSNIRAWFHGHENFCQMYDYTGPDNDLSIPVFRSDSPMKGERSRPDESQLSFQVITIDPSQRSLTARECFWNKERRPGSLSWGMQRVIHW